MAAKAVARPGHPVWGGPGLFAAGMAALLLFPGCGGSGGGGSAPATAQMVFRVVFPESTRLIPLASNSVVISVLVGGGEIARALVPRPAQGGAATATLNGVPVGNVTINAAAFPNADGTGVAQAAASLPFLVRAGVVNSVDLTMVSTIDHLEVAPANPVLSSGDTLLLTMTAKDKGGAVVLVSPAVVSWQSANTGIVGVDNTGKVTAALAGATSVSVTDSESGKTGATTVTVKLAVKVNPPTVNVAVNGTTTFTATVAGSTDQRVTWSVQESNGGSIAQDGTYSAPAAAGTFHVIATSVADPTRSGTATVNVQSGNTQIIVK